MLLDDVIKEAIKIRRSLQARRKRTFKKNGYAHHYLYLCDTLEGACGLASVLLCIAIDDRDLKSLRGTHGHVWNVFDRTVVDITATQFDCVDPKNLVHGVYVSTKSQEFHRSPYIRRGKEQFNRMLRDKWYDAQQLGATIAEIHQFRTCVDSIRGFKEVT